MLAPFLKPKSKKFFEFLKMEHDNNFYEYQLREAFVINDLEAFKYCLDNLGIFIPNVIFEEVGSHTGSGKEKMTELLIERKMKNDELIEKIQSLPTIKARMDFTEIEYALVEIKDIKLVDLWNIQNLLSFGYKLGCERKYPINNIWIQYRNLQSLVDELLNKIAFSGDFIAAYNVLKAVETKQAPYKFDHKNCELHKMIIEKLEKGSVGAFKNDGVSSHIQPTTHLHYYDFIKKELLFFSERLELKEKTM